MIILSTFFHMKFRWRVLQQKLTFLEVCLHGSVSLRKNTIDPENEKMRKHGVRSSIIT